ARFRVADLDRAGEPFAGRADDPEQAVQQGMIERLGEGDRQRRCGARAGHLDLPSLRVDRLVVGWADTEALAIGLFQGVSLGIAPLPVDDEGVAFAGFEDGAEVLARLQAPPDPARIEEERETPPGRVPELLAQLEE